MPTINTVVRLGAMLLLPLVAACAPPAPSQGVGEPPPADDAAGLAAYGIAQQCLPLESADRPRCYEVQLLGILREQGVRPAMAALERLERYDENVRRDGHTYAHAVGLAAFTTAEEVGRTFQSCTPIYQSGCYHGVIQSYFSAHSRTHGDHIDAATVNAVCGEARQDAEGRWLLFQCAHGLGHGLTMLTGQRLKGALEICDLVESDWEREACYGGVFMEVVVAATVPHHAVGRPQDAAGGDHHGHSGSGHDQHAAAAPAPDPHAHHHGTPPTASSSGEQPFALDPSNRHYPCSALEDRYLFSCYQMQTSVVLHQNGGDFADGAAFCDEVPLGYRSVCYMSLGRDVSSYVVQDHEQAMERCSLGKPGLLEYCHVGYMKNLIDLTADHRDGMQYCRLLTTQYAKALCYRGAGEQIWSLGSGEMAREERCQDAEPDYISRCREGAGLPSEGPRGARAGQ